MARGDKETPEIEVEPVPTGRGHRTLVTIKTPEGMILAGSRVTSDKLPSGEFDRLLKDGDIVKAGER